jgi:hypothetical protein
MLLVGDTVELYVDDELVFNGGLDNTGNYLPGLFANNGSIEIDNLKVYGLWQ